MEQNQKQLTEMFSKIFIDNFSFIIDHNFRDEIKKQIELVYTTKQFSKNVINTTSSSHQYNKSIIINRIGMTNRFSKCVLDNYDLCDKNAYESMIDVYEKNYYSNLPL